MSLAAFALAGIGVLLLCWYLVTKLSDAHRPS
jgi:hypothetical protein